MANEIESVYIFAQKVAEACVESAVNQSAYPSSYIAIVEQRDAAIAARAHAAEKHALDRLATIKAAWQRYSVNDLSREEFEGTIAEMVER